MLKEARMTKKHRIYSDEQEQLQLSGSLPTDILLEILSRLPLKFLCSLRKVCKSWYAVICSHRFAKMHYARAINNASPSLVLYSGRFEFHWLDHLVFDDYQDFASAYRLKFDEFSQMDHIEYQLYRSSANGLVCFFPFTHNGIFKPHCIWNPVIQEHVLLPQSPRFKTIAASGFGYDSSNDKYKVVRILPSSGGRAQSALGGEAEAEIYTLGSGMWRSIKNVPYPEESLVGYGIFLNGSCHWLSCDSPFILVFSLTTEQFHVMHLPAIVNIPNEWCRRHLKVLGKWLCISFWSPHITPWSPKHEFWVMKDYEKQEWTKEYDFGATYDDKVFPVMKLMNGEVLCYKPFSWHKLSYYEPQTNIYRKFMVESDRVQKPFLLVQDIIGSLFSPEVLENPKTRR